MYMSNIFGNANVDVSKLVSGLRLYVEKDYRHAISPLTDVLDAFPENWDARLMLSACYYKTGQIFAAQRGFRYLYQHCPIDHLKSKSLEALRASLIRVVKKLPAEFGCEEWQPVQARISWIEEHLHPKQDMWIA